MGYCYKTKIEPYELDNIVDVREVKDIGSISEKAEKYLRKCIELCQNQGIEIVLTNTPWPDITIETQQQYNKIQQIAEEYGVAFLNGCLMNEELGMDYRVDSMGDWGHLNYTGVTKWTKWLGRYLANKYELPDRRGDSKYKMWEYQSAKLNARIRMDNIAQAEDLESLTQSLQQTDGLCCAIEIRGDYLRGDMVIPETILGKQLDLTRRGGYIIRDGKIIDYGDGRQDYNLCLYLNNCVMNVRSIGEDKAIIFEGNKYTMVENGINILIYDEYLKQIVGKFGIDVDNGYKLVK